MPAPLVWIAVIDSVATLAVFFIISSLRKTHAGEFLRDWGWGFASWSVYAAAIAVDAMSAGHFVQTHPFRFVAAIVAAVAATVALGFLLLAARRFSGHDATFPVRRNLSIAAGVAALVAIGLSAAPDEPLLRHLALFTLPNLVAAVVASYTAWSLPSRNGMSAAIFTIALGTVGVSHLAISATLLGAFFRPLGVTLLISLAAARAAFEVAAALAIVIRTIDSERTAAVEAVSQVEHLAYHDPLTGLPNRSLFFDRLVIALANASRHQHRVAVLFLDLDRFKLINDSLGHSVGDGVIRSVADRLRHSVRQGDTIARFGGDEFIILLGVIARSEDAARVAQKVVETFELPFTAGAREFSVSTSVGIAVYPADGTDAETLVRNADTAMYRAKESGDAYRFYAPGMNARALEMLELENDLRRAITRNELLLHYQPLVDLECGKVYGLEALLRWQHPKLGLLYPDRFMATAESTGLIIPIGKWVLRESCRQLKLWQRSLGPDLVVSVNLSPRQFEQPDLTGQVKAALEEAGLRPRHLELEITESKAMQDVDKTIRILRELKALGVRLSIDDFGTGYSSLSYLKQFPVDTLKLDQSFVREITVPEDGAIARGVIAMAHSLSLKVLAEGVETLGQLDFLRAHSCDRLQGFLFSRPLEAASFERFLTHNGRTIRVA